MLVSICYYFAIIERRVRHEMTSSESVSLPQNKQHTRLTVNNWSWTDSWSTCRRLEELWSPFCQHSPRTKPSWRRDDKKNFNVKSTVGNSWKETTALFSMWDVWCGIRSSHHLSAKPVSIAKSRTFLLDKSTPSKRKNFFEYFQLFFEFLAFPLMFIFAIFENSNNRWMETLLLTETQTNATTWIRCD